MEHIVLPGTPLGILLEGEGEAQALSNQTPFDTSESTSQHSYGPPVASRLRSRLRSNTLEKLHLRLAQGLGVASNHDNIVSPTGNAHFLEHFRYILVASHLLEEHIDQGLLRATSKQALGSADLDHIDAGVVTAQALPLLVLLALASVGTLKWLLAIDFSLKTAIGATAFLLPLLAIFTLSTSHVAVLHLRNEAIRTASVFVRSLQAFEMSMSTSLALLQEIEVVSKGYKMSTPLPPISRQDEIKTLRRCGALRHQLRQANTRLAQNLIDAFATIDSVMIHDDYDKYIDVYDISREAISEIINTAIPDDMDLESLGALKFLSHRSAVMRRATMCKLLSFDSTHRWTDRLAYTRRLRTMTKTMHEISVNVTTSNASIAEVLKNLEYINLPMSPKATPSHANDRLRNQVRKISNLSSGIRSLQAKMTLLREESNSALSRADDLTDLGPDLLLQYESIGQDIQALLHDWENGKAALSSNIRKHEHRISLASSGMHSPENTSFMIPPLPIDRAMDLLSGPADGLSSREGSSSPKSSMPSTPPDEEVFEAIALPKPRIILSREERIQAMQEERLRAEERKEARESGATMMKELKSVINLRKRPTKEHDAAKDNGTRSLSSSGVPGLGTQ